MEQVTITPSITINPDINSAFGPHPICICSGVGVLGGQLYAAGGHDGPLVRKSVEVFDPQTNSWRLVCDMNMCRRNAGQKPLSTYYQER